MTPLPNMMDVGMILLCLVLVSLVLLYIILPYKFTSRRIRKFTDKIPGPPGLPYLGNILMFKGPHENTIPIVMRLCDEYGTIWKIRNLGADLVFLTNEEDIELNVSTSVDIPHFMKKIPKSLYGTVRFTVSVTWCLTDVRMRTKERVGRKQLLSNTKYISKSVTYTPLKPWLNDGLLLSTGVKWHSHRKLLTSAFHFKILEEFIPIFNKNSNILVEKLSEYVDKGCVPINKLVSLCTLDIICETAMGTCINAQTSRENEYAKAVLRISELIFHRLLSPWLWRPFTLFLSPTGWEQRKTLRTLHGFTEKGHDTTSAGISWALYLLGRNPHVQDRVVEELQGIFGDSDRPATFSDLQAMKYLEQVIKESLRLYPSVPFYGRYLEDDIIIRTDVNVVPTHIHRNPRIYPDPEVFNPDRFSKESSQERHPFAYLPFSAGPRNCIELQGIFGDSDRPATFSDLQAMKYLEQVIKESLRLYPSVPFYGRYLEDDIIIKNYTIPAGTDVNVVPTHIHRNPRIYPDPEVFNPDRFSKESSQERHPFAYLPFSAGPRNCIGQRFALLEEKAVLSTVLRHFQIESLDRPEDIAVLGELILRPKHELRIKFTLRN
uniref:Cytochrome P450 n=1 Tax=Timema poppense TaxID=170557 RepID=A0A7R9H689_TIMPO|nr:unnamed protein product [Timema poppensis]